MANLMNSVEIIGIDIAAPDKFALKWKNLYFNKDGSNCYGYILHPSQEIAETLAQNGLDKLFSGEVSGYFVGGIRMTKETYSWHMQVPFI